MRRLAPLPAQATSTHKAHGLPSIEGPSGIEASSGGLPVPLAGSEAIASATPTSSSMRPRCRASPSRPPTRTSSLCSRSRRATSWSPSRRPSRPPPRRTSTCCSRPSLPWSTKSTRSRTPSWPATRGSVPRARPPLPLAPASRPTPTPLATSPTSTTSSSPACAPSRTPSKSSRRSPWPPKATLTDFLPMLSSPPPRRLPPTCPPSPAAGRAGPAAATLSRRLTTRTRRPTGRTSAPGTARPRPSSRRTRLAPPASSRTCSPRRSSTRLPPPLRRFRRSRRPSYTATPWMSSLKRSLPLTACSPGLATVGCGDIHVRRHRLRQAAARPVHQVCPEALLRVPRRLDIFFRRPRLQDPRPGMGRHPARRRVLRHRHPLAHQVVRGLALPRQAMAVFFLLPLLRLLSAGAPAPSDMASQELTAPQDASA
mmetsp:Transcript_127306/g.396227  ORF Transcript_127306/g.396227 Transcript_127306/m.396227 type:complete len:426 (-) Transcript_127306:6-1283(-)